jgi:hypothetical protein
MAMESISIIMEHQQPLVHTLQNLDSCLFQYNPISKISNLLFMEQNSVTLSNANAGEVHRVRVAIITNDTIRLPFAVDILEVVG